MAVLYSQFFLFFVFVQNSILAYSKRTGSFLLVPNMVKCYSCWFFFFALSFLKIRFAFFVSNLIRVCVSSYLFLSRSLDLKWVFSSFALSWSRLFVVFFQFFIRCGTADSTFICMLSHWLFLEHFYLNKMRRFVHNQRIYNKSTVWQFFEM